MSPVAIGMDLLLAALLMLALSVGLRLSRQLKALRDGQLAFARSVAELDTAAGRAEAGLKAIRATTEETHDSLLNRIETARGLIARLEQATDRAEKAAQAAPQVAPQAASLSSPVRVVPEAPAREARVIDLPAAEARPIRAPAGPPARLRPRGLDDDLFEAPAPARGGMRSAR